MLFTFFSFEAKAQLLPYGTSMPAQIKLTPNSNVSPATSTDGSIVLGNDNYAGMAYLATGNRPFKIVENFQDSPIFLAKNGKIGIGVNFTNSSSYLDGFRLFVRDGIRTERVKVDMADYNGWADYVFEPNYKLRPLSEVEAFIQKNKHLPDVPSEKEIHEKGMDLGEMHKIQMQKIEELTLYLLEMKKQNDVLKKRIESLENPKK